MIPNHPRFVEAIHERKKVSVRFYSQADGGVVDRICAPLDYGPGPGIEFPDGLNRYWVWDYTTGSQSQALGLVPQQIVELQVLGEQFDPAQLGVAPVRWSISRDWGASSQATEMPGSAAPPAAS